MSDSWSVISVDDHVIEPPNTWTSRVPQRFRDRCPRVVPIEEPEPTFGWEFDGKVMPFAGLMCMVDHQPEEWEMTVRSFGDLYSGCSDPAVRIKDMDQSHVAASLCFPTMPGFGGSWLQFTQDRELSLACIRAYNDFILDEWCGYAPERLIPGVLIPYWDAGLAEAEMARTAARGARAIAFNERPQHQGWPSLFDSGYWDPFFAAAVDHELVVCCHIGSSSFTDIPADANYLTRFSSVWLNAPHSMVEFVFSQTFDRHPQLKVAYSEASIGWIPYVLQTMDRYWERHAAWTHTEMTRPSDFFGRNIFGCFIEDEVGARSIEDLGADAVMVEVDYPHTDSIWPGVRDVIDKQLAHLTPEDQYKVRRGNAERLFRWHDAPEF